MRSFRDLSIKHKMMLVFLSVNLISVIIMATVSQYFYSKEVKRDFNIISQEATTRLNHHIDFYFKQMIDSTASLAVSDEVQQFLTVDRPYSVNEIDDLSQLLTRYMALNYSEIACMLLVSGDNKRVVSTEGVYQSDSSKYVLEPWYSKNDLLLPAIFPTHRVNYLGYKGSPVISVVVPIFNPKTVGLKGRLVIELTLAEIKETFDNSRLGETLGEFFIVADDDTIVYHPREEWIGARRADTGLASLRLSGESGVSTQRLNGDVWLVAATKSSIADWSIVFAVPFAEMAGGLNAATNAILVFFLILSVLIVLIIPLLSGSYLNPLLAIRNLMGMVARGDLTVQAGTNSVHYEFRQLNNSFNYMVARINELMETVNALRTKEFNLQLMQKEAMIKALQNQINPHLLYNTLDLIRSIAYLKHVPQITMIALNLGDVYRYTAKFAEDEVTLSDELDHLQKYLEIVSFRFPGQFQSKYYVNDNFRDCQLIKLTLQPIVENAVKYAIEPLGGHGTILLSAYETGGDLVIEVVDNGDGFPPHKLEEITAELSYISQNAHDRFTQRDNLGISNVHARLVLKYGEQYGVSIDSFEGRGSVVSIRVPFRKMA